MRILIADDDEISRRFLREACTASGCECTAVCDGAEALAAATTSRFDVLILDLHMPHLGGAQLLDILRSRGVATRAIATSADLGSDALEKLLQAGFSDALSKPVSIDRLGRAIGRTATIAPMIADTLLDDSSALASVGGDRRTLRALRELLVRELDLLVEDLASETPPQMFDRLHQLRASCGFCGAVALADAALEFRNALNGNAADPTSARENFIHACNVTRISLIQPDEPEAAPV